MIFDKGRSRRLQKSIVNIGGDDKLTITTLAFTLNGRYLFRTPNIVAQTKSFQSR